MATDLGRAIYGDGDPERSVLLTVGELGSRKLGGQQRRRRTRILAAFKSRAQSWTHGRRSKKDINTSSKLRREGLNGQGRINPLTRGKLASLF